MPSKMYLLEYLCELHEQFRGSQQQLLLFANITQSLCQISKFLYQIRTQMP